MLSSISWSQFFYGLFIALVIYYVYIIFKYYGDELNAIVKGKSIKPIVTPSTPDVKREPNTLQQESLLGQTNFKRPEIVPNYNAPLTAPAIKSTVLPEIETYEEAEISYETVEQIDLDMEDGYQAYSESIPVDSLNDLVDGIDTVISGASENEADKESMANALRALLEPHQSLNSNEFRENINEHIVRTAEQTGAPVISKTEVAAFWDKAMA